MTACVEPRTQQPDEDEKKQVSAGRKKASVSLKMSNQMEVESQRERGGKKGEKKKSRGGQGGGAGSNFIPGSPALLVSVGADGRVLIVDRRLDSIAACYEAGVPLTSIACKDDGSTLAVGTQGACRPS